MFAEIADGDGSARTGISAEHFDHLVNGARFLGCGCGFSGRCAGDEIADYFVFRFTLADIGTGVGEDVADIGVGSVCGEGGE
ncbi:hypothetical protein, partial [Nocardia donostiensis]|uniref:hypothetical protein n=1 Tax=Nocardia donostiensis TaxID=1538463 RepID=UPI00111C1F48